ncbi:MAG: prephenate dehydrogenase/arogenate dehydrogenase family protein [Gammaproteobacteria bacterium]
MINRLCIIGVGLIGGSLARALKQAGYCAEVVGCGRDAVHLRRAQEIGVIDRYERDPARAVDDADMIVLAVPLGAMEVVMRTIAGHVAADAVITDVGSTKGGVVTAAQAAFGAVPERFVPGHPIAGTEKSGVEASFADLFQERRVILTPLDHSDADAVAAVREMWERTGAEVMEMSVAHHDEILAATSHLPHMLAFALVDTLARMHEQAEIFRYAAGGFRDFTRIASSDPVMWRDICLANREAIAAMIDRFQGDLAGLREAIVKGDGRRIEEIFVRAKAARDRYCE